MRFIEKFLPSAGILRPVSREYSTQAGYDGSNLRKLFATAKQATGWRSADGLVI
jgi:hypothetical protein